MNQNIQATEVHSVCLHMTVTTATVMCFFVIWQRCTTDRRCACYPGYHGYLCDEVRPSQTQGSTTSDVTNSSVSENSNNIETKWLVTIILVVAAAVIVSLIIGFLFCRLV